MYQADRNAVSELLKITDVLNDALNTNKTNESEGFSKLDTSLTYKVIHNKSRLRNHNKIISQL